MCYLDDAKSSCNHQNVLTAVGVGHPENEDYLLDQSVLDQQESSPGKSP